MLLWQPRVVPLEYLGWVLKVQARNQGSIVSEREEVNKKVGIGVGKIETDRVGLKGSGIVWIVFGRTVWEVED